MKKLTLLFTILLVTLSCSKTEIPTEEVFVPDPTIIAEYHTFTRQGNILEKYIFDDSGRFSEYIDINDVSVSFEYDTNNRIISLTNTNLQDNSAESFALTYDGDGRILSFGDRTFTYYPDDNYYIEDSSHYTYDVVDELDSNIVYTDEYFNKHSADTNGIIKSFCGYGIYSKTFLDTNTTEIDWEGCEGLRSYSVSYDANVESIFYDDYPYNYRYDGNSNPLYFPESNLSDLLVLFAYQNLYGFGYNRPEKLFVAASQNNLIESGESCYPNNTCGPEGLQFTYEFNALNLPMQSNAQVYYVGSPEGDPFINAKYYYQTDDIPE